MQKSKLLALLELADIKAENIYELANEYWPKHPDYQKVRDEDPWWLVKTSFGMIKIGWCKRVINIDWSDTSFRQIISEDDVTKGEDHIHAWGYAKALEYLIGLKKVLE